MGQNESKPSSSTPVVAKRSYYDLLGVDRNATDDELKKAYRTRALTLHPDRNFGKEQEATEQFAEIQAAYEVLADPQDRAWYDTYELAAAEAEAGGSGFKRNHAATAGRRGREQPDILDASDLTSFFGEYHGVKRASLKTDGQFWTGVTALFDRLAREEVNAAKMAGEWDSAPVYPSLSSPLLSSTDEEYESVVKPFYSAWSGFATRKTFAWLDRYDEEDGEDRRMRRAIEKENKRAREAQAREFNAAVRMLVGFLRKSDPRVEERSGAASSAAESERIAREKVMEQKKRAREANEAKLQEAMKNEQQNTWNASRADASFDDSDEESDDQDPEHFECVACDKFFKSAKQYEAHERSKKHRKAVWELRKFMEKEDADLHLGGQDMNAESTDDKELQADEANDNVLSNTAQVHPLQTLDTTTEAMTELKVDSTVSTDADNSDDEEKPATDAEEVAVHPDHLSSKASAESSPAVPKLGKAAQKRARKAAAATVSQDSGDPEASVKCAVCNAAFTSRSRLFQHIKDLNHAAPVVQVGGKKKKGKR
jgi:DnaJ homolog subfamily A member 5